MPQYQTGTFSNRINVIITYKDIGIEAYLGVAVSIIFFAVFSIFNAMLKIGDDKMDTKQTQ